MKCKELLNLTTLKGLPSIITYEGFSLIHQLLIEMPLADCSLENLLENEIGFSEEEALFVLYQISLGLQQAHDKKITHLDLEPENILLVDGKIMIADWGSLRLKNSNSTAVKQEISYTRGYEAPELFEDNYRDKEKYYFYSCENLLACHASV